MTARIPVLEIGGSHVTAAWVTTGAWQVTDAVTDQVQPHGSAGQLIGSFSTTADRLAAEPGAHWSVAMPGPFDYARGIGLFANVGKFDSLLYFDVRSGLANAITGRPGRLTFINDASAFAVGEWVAGAAQGADRCVAITLGTGVGSAFLRAGEPISAGPEVPPDGEIHLIDHHGTPLEDLVSQRAIRRSYAAARGLGERSVPDVREIADRARAGEPVARQVLTDAFGVLGVVLAPWLRRFGAQVLVVGGSISRSWDLIHEPLATGLASLDIAVRPAANLAHSSLIGAAAAA